MAQSPWYFSSNMNIVGGNYEKSTRRSAEKASISMRADYLETASFAIKLGKAIYYYSQSPTSVQQNQLGGFGSYSIYNDFCNGKLTSSLIYYQVSDSITDWHSTGANFSCTNNSKSLYFGLGITASAFEDDTDKFDISQLTPSYGRTFWRSRLWFHLTLNYISTDKTNYLNAHSSLTYFTSSPNSSVVPNKIILGALAGESRFLFDSFNLLAYNTKDMYKQSYYLAFIWNVLDYTHLSLSIGREDFSDPSKNDYYLTFASLNFTINW